jgi:ribonuclease D
VSSPTSALPDSVNPILVSDPAGLAALINAIDREPVVALDTESNSFHVYYERICLLQISTRVADYIVDPMAVDARPLGRALTNGCEVVLHGADYDVRCMKREYQWNLPRLFDTMIAAQRLAWPALGLSALVKSCFGVHLSKEHQRSDWGRRPLDQRQLHYAALDTHYLLPLYDLLSAELQKHGLSEVAGREFVRIAAVKPKAKVFDPEGYRRLRGCRDLDAPGRAVLRALWKAREDRAGQIDRPPFKVLGEQTMVDIARRRPRTIDELMSITGVTRNVLRDMGESIRAALNAAP